MKMKKLSAVVLALAMAMSLCTTAFATEPNRNSKISTLPGNQDITVTGTYAGDPSETYSVDVVWGAMEFTYNANGKTQWNPEQHEYILADGGAAAKWEYEGNTVTVTNHSNKDVNVSFSFAKDTSVKGNYEGVFAYDGSINKASADTVKLNAGVEHAYDKADKVVATLTIADGYLDASNKNANLTLGTITVTVTAA